LRQRVRTSNDMYIERHMAWTKVIR